MNPGRMIKAAASKGWCEWLDSLEWDTYHTLTFKEDTAPEQGDKEFNRYIRFINEARWGKRYRKKGCGINWVKASERQRPPLALPPFSTPPAGGGAGPSPGPTGTGGAIRRRPEPGGGWATASRRLDSRRAATRAGQRAARRRAGRQAGAGNLGSG